MLCLYLLQKSSEYLLLTIIIQSESRNAWKLVLLLLLQLYLGRKSLYLPTWYDLDTRLELMQVLIFDFTFCCVKQIALLVSLFPKVLAMPAFLALGILLLEKFTIQHLYRIVNLLYLTPIFFLCGSNGNLYMVKAEKAGEKFPVFAIVSALKYSTYFALATLHYESNVYVRNRTMCWR